MKILFVEDDKRDLETFEATCRRYVKQSQNEIEFVPVGSSEDALGIIDKTFDGAIVDIKLGKETRGGNDVIQNIRKNFRIPVAIMTGTPANVDTSFTYLGVFKKGEVGYDEILDNLVNIHKTGLTKIVGGRGVIEQTMTEVFWRNIIPQMATWQELSKQGLDTEQAILRYTLIHLQDLLDSDTESYLPEEMYLAPPIVEGIRTGSIINSKTDGKSYIVLNPACDLVLRKNGAFKTDKVLICGIEKFSVIRDLALDGIVKNEKKKDKLIDLLKNNYANYYHWLPRTNYYEGGFVNFRWLSSITPEEYKEAFETPKLQVSPSFIKDVISRFSSYYARQGQPDFDFESISDKAIEHLNTKTK